MTLGELDLKGDTYNRLEELGIETVEELQRKFEEFDPILNQINKRMQKEIKERLSYL